MNDMFSPPITLTGFRAVRGDRPVQGSKEFLAGAGGRVVVVSWLAPCAGMSSLSGVKWVKLPVKVLIQADWGSHR